MHVALQRTRWLGRWAGILSILGSVVPRVAESVCCAFPSSWSRRVALHVFKFSTSSHEGICNMQSKYYVRDGTSFLQSK